MARMEIKKGDYGYYLQFPIQGSDGNAKDLTGYTVKVKVWKAGSPDSLLFEGSCEIVDPATSGICQYKVQSGDLSAIGKYKAEVELTKTGVVESTETFDFEIKESG